MNVRTNPSVPTHRHEALLYRDHDEFVARTSSFLRAGVEAGESVVAALSAPKRTLLQDALGPHASAVHFIDMERVGRNPGRLISHWHDVVSARPGRRVRGVGEPVSPERSAQELEECAASEALWNLAFAEHDLWVLCPYDVAALDADVVDTVFRTHPVVTADGHVHHSGDYAEQWAWVLAQPLSEPAAVRSELRFGALRAVRGAVTRFAFEAGATAHRVEEFALAVGEVAGNSLRHGGGSGMLRLWEDDDAVVAEVRDRGHIRDPLVGRLRPHEGQTGGRGLWMAHQLCDLVQVRSGEAGTTVRLHLRTA